jgi:hypothetical protein
MASHKAIFIGGAPGDWFLDDREIRAAGPRAGKKSIF